MDSTNDEENQTDDEITSPIGEDDDAPFDEPSDPTPFTPTDDPLSDNEDGGTDELASDEESDIPLGMDMSDPDTEEDEDDEIQVP